MLSIQSASMLSENNKIYIIYDESDMTGFEDTTTTIKVSDGNVSVRRSGRYTSKMNYLTGEKKSLSDKYAVWTSRRRNNYRKYKF